MFEGQFKNEHLAFPKQDTNLDVGWSFSARIWNEGSNRAGRQRQERIGDRQGRMGKADKRTKRRAFGEADEQAGAEELNSRSMGEGSALLVCATAAGTARSTGN